MIKVRKSWFVRSGDYPWITGFQAPSNQTDSLRGPLPSLKSPLLNRKRLWFSVWPKDRHMASLGAKLVCVSALFLSFSSSLSRAVPSSLLPPLHLFLSFCPPSLPLHLMVGPVCLGSCFTSSRHAGPLLTIPSLVWLLHLLARPHSPLENEFQCPWPLGLQPSLIFTQLWELLLLWHTWLTKQ